MEIPRGNILIFILLLFFIQPLCAQKDFSKLTISTDSSFGYTELNPLKLKNGNQQKSIMNSENFLSGLRTQDDQRLIFLFRSSMRNPNYKEPLIKSKDIFSGDLGMLDRYVFLTTGARDTISLC